MTSPAQFHQLLIRLDSNKIQLLCYFIDYFQT